MRDQNPAFKGELQGSKNLYSYMLLVYMFETSGGRPEFKGSLVYIVGITRTMQ